MKKILLSAFAMLLAVTANAQNITVESYRARSVFRQRLSVHTRLLQKLKLPKTSVSWVSMMILRLVTIT